MSILIFTYKIFVVLYKKVSGLPFNGGGRDERDDCAGDEWDSTQIEYDSHSILESPTHP